MREVRCIMGTGGGGGCNDLFADLEGQHGNRKVLRDALPLLLGNYVT